MDVLQHYGILGMRWGNRKTSYEQELNYGRKINSTPRSSSKSIKDADRDAELYVALRNNPIVLPSKKNKVKKKILDRAKVDPVYANEFNSHRASYDDSISISKKDRKAIKKTKKSMKKSYMNSKNTIDRISEGNTMYHRMDSTWKHYKANSPYVDAYKDLVDSMSHSEINE